MKLNDIEEIIECLPDGRTLFPYFSGRYALMLLSWVFNGEHTIQEVKLSRYSGLLQKPCVKHALANSGKNTLCTDSLTNTWHEPHEQFLLTLGHWGGTELQLQQTSRIGHNLVLQVNLHDGYGKSLDAPLPEELAYWFANYGHPVLERGQREFFRKRLAG